MSEDIVKIKYKATAELVADGIKKAIKPSDVKREAQQTAKAMQSAMDGQKIEIPAEIVPDTSKLDKAKKEAEKPIKTPVKLETEDVDLPLLGKTPIKLSIDKDSRTAIKKTLKDAEKASKSLIDSAARTVKKIGSANYLEELTKNEQQSVSNAVAKVKRNNPGISEDKLKTFEQNLILDRRAKKTHETLSENFKLPGSSSKAYGQEMYEAAIAAAKIQAAVKIREDLHENENYTQFLSKNDRSKSYNGNTLKIPGKFIDQIQTGLYEHFGVSKLGTALSSGKNWTGIQDRMTQSIDSFGAGLSAAINASSGKRITKEFQARIDSAVKTAVGMSIDDAISHLSGTKGTKESKKALSLLDRKQNGEYKYSIDDIYDILMDRTPTGKNATAGEDAVSGVNYKGFNDLFAALQVYQRSGSSKLDKNHVKRLSELVSAIVSEFQDSTYNAQTVIDSINTSLDQAQIEAEKVAKEQSKIEDKSKPKKSSKKSSSTTPKKKQTSTTKVEHYIPNIEGDSTYAKLANQNYTTKSKEEALQKLSESFETWNDALPDTHGEHALKYIYKRCMLEAYQMGASIDELSKFSLTDLSNKAPRYFVKMVEKAGEQFKVFADLYDYVASINKSLLKKNTIKNLLDSIAKGQIAAKRKFGESLELTDGGDLIGISESYKPDFVKEFISLQKKRQQDLNKEIAKVTGTESNINVLPEYYNSLLKLFESSTTPQIEEKKIKETAKTEPKKVEESNPKKAESSPKTEESKKAEKKIEQKQDKTEEIEEPKYSFSPRLTKNNQKKHDSRFTGRLYDQKQLMDFASAPLNRSPKIKSNSGIFDKNGNYYVVSGNKAPDYVYKRIQYKHHAANSEKSSSLRSRQELTDFSKRPDFDQTRVRSYVDDSYKPKYKVVKKSPVIKTGPKIGYDNGKLYPTANVPDDFSGLKQLSQRESAAGKKLVKTYQDVDKSIITLTQTYEENEETGASGWKNSVSRYSDFKALGTEAAKITNKILKQKADLDTEMSKPDDKQNQYKIKELKENIKANQADRREIADIARSIANDSSNGYKFSDFVDAVSKGSREQRNALNATKKTNKESIETRQVADNYDSILKSTKKIDAYNKSELGLMQEQEKYTAGTDEHNSIAKQIKKVTDARKQEQESIKKIVGNDGVGKWIENNKSVLDKKKKDISELATARRNVETSERSITDYINQSSISDRYKAAISDIKELQKAQEKLSNLQKEQIENPNKDISSDIADAVSEYKRLSDTVKDFRENIYGAEKSQKELTDNKQFKEYNSAYDQTTKNVKDNQKSLSQSLKDAYKTQNRYEKKLLTPGTYNNSQNVTDAIEQLEYAKRTSSFIEKQMREVYGNEYANKEIARIQSSVQAKTGSSSSIFNNSETMSTNIGSISEKLSAYTASIEKANKATEEFTNRKQGISEKISALKDDYNNGNLSVSDYAKRMQEINNDFSALKEYMTTGAGKNASEYTEIFNKLNKLENSTNKVGQYHEILQGFESEFQKIKSDYKDDGDLDKYNQSISNLVSRMKDFQKTSKNFVATNSKGTLIGESIGKVSDINDATTALENYATKLGYANKTSQSINESTGKVNMTFENASGNVLKMSGVIEELNENMKGLRVSTNVLYSGSGGSGSFLGGLKNLVSGNFKSIVGEIGSSVANVQILGQAFQQMKDGFNTFLDFNKGLTNISYTMDMSKEQLSSLGSSAVDMAKDLSMSLDNTMDIYQIYANMNTTSKEIQETAKPTAILSNLSGVDASTAADQVQGILQQFHMLEDGSTTAADASMHVVDVLDKISGAVGMDYAKGIKVMTDAVQASGQVAFDAGMSYEQLAAISAKVAERTREDGSSIGNALKTIITRTTKVGKMPQYADEVDNATLSNASESLHSVGIDVYNPDGSDRGIITVLSELKAKWDDLSDAQQAKIAFDVAATRQTSKFKSILDAFSESMTLAGEATTTSGNAEANQEKYMESFSGKIQAIKTQMDEFWLNFYNSDQVSGALDFVQGLTEGFTGLEEAIGPIPTLITAVFLALTVKNAAAKGLEFLVGKDGQASGLANAVG